LKDYDLGGPPPAPAGPPAFGDRSAGALIGSIDFALKASVSRGIPTMRTIDEARIDNKCRTSALTGLVKPGERYKVIKASEQEIRLLRMEVEQPKLPKVRMVTIGGRKLLTSDRPVNNADTQRVMEQFP
jgi:hypothetical protein